MEKDEVVKYEIIEGNCPLLDLPCTQGEETALRCWTRVKRNFDPLSSFGDLSILECAMDRSHKMRAASIKFIS